MSVFRQVAGFIGLWCINALPWLVAWIVYAPLNGWPSNDDPFYAKSIAAYANGSGWIGFKQQGELTASSVAHQMLGLLSLSVGEFSYRNLYLVCIAQQSLGSAVVTKVGRALGLSFGVSLLLATMLAWFPIYFGQAFTFMTDGPATAWALIGCCFGLLAIVRDQWQWGLVASFTFGLSLWMRQTNLVLLLAPLSAWVLVGFAVRRQLQVNWLLAGALIAPSLASVLALESGWIVESSVSRFEYIRPTIDGYWRETTIAGYGALLLVGWFLMPGNLLLVGAVRDNWTRANGLTRKVCLGWVAAVLALGFGPLAATSGGACLTNSTGSMVQNAHYGPIFLSDMDELGRWGQLDGVEWPMSFWKFLSAAAIVSCAVSVGWGAWTFMELQNQWKLNATDLRMRLLAMAVGLLLAAASGATLLIFFVQPHLDRYWLFVLSALLVWLLILLIIQRKSSAKPSGYRSVGSAAVCVSLSGLMSLIFTHDMLAWNDARWRYVKKQIEFGLVPEQIDAGRDVNAWFRMDEDPNTMPRTGDRSQWWSGRAQYSIAVGSREGWHEIDRLPWTAWATGRTHHLKVLERDISTGQRNNLLEGRKHE